MANMILYLVNEYHMEMATASNILFLWTAANNFMPVLGAAIADSYLGRFCTIGLGSIAYMMGMVLLWSTALIAQAQPPPCDQSSDSCSSPTFLQSMVLCSSLGLIAVGSGGIRASSMAFGADQLENEDGKENSSVGESYFSWNREFKLPSDATTNIIYYHKNGPAPGFPSSKLRFSEGLHREGPAERPDARQKSQRSMEPLHRRSSGRTQSITQAMIVTAAVESMRRDRAIKEGNGSDHHLISALWLMPQYCLLGLADGFNDFTQSEFYYSELPRRGRQGWISSDINKGRYDYYYLVLAGLSMGNMVYYLVCRRAYGPTKDERRPKENEDEL
ncbi:UNVERIFIED_CONTAM: protein NRT1/ PTR FAMILY 1.2 [Sesamum calycinum]|uniref:Protein NRT1/ PTR FAMILY 1.2 n=1 Tax=Sesamum calycinum TaxID=2727403 RepID=A0AAW2LZ86_9LAMI